MASRRCARARGVSRTAARASGHAVDGPMEVPGSDDRIPFLCGKRHCIGRTMRWSRSAGSVASNCRMPAQARPTPLGPQIGCRTPPDRIARGHLLKRTTGRRTNPNDPWPEDSAGSTSSPRWRPCSRGRLLDAEGRAAGLWAGRAGARHSVGGAGALRPRLKRRPHRAVLPDAAPGANSMRARPLCLAAYNPRSARESSCSRLLPSRW